MAENGALFDNEFLRKLEYLNIISKNLLPGHLHGEHRAKKVGTGLEFADYRQYVPGEDVSNVDWRTYLRLDKLILRLFEEEADLPIYIFFDASQSMNFGEPLKFDYARKVAAALCYIGLLNLDRVNLVAFADGVAAEMSSRRGKNQVWQAFRFLESVSPGGETSMQEAFKGFFSGRRRKGLVVVISDFFDENGMERGLDMLRFFRQDVFSVQVFSRSEARPDLPDEVLLVDSEDGSNQRVKVTPGLLEAYARKFDEHCEGIRSTCRKYGWGYVRTATEVPFEDLILRVFRQGRFLG
ncbi:MAG: DUF58 domain-containing protein [Acidobacteriota bacterium]